MGLIVLVLTESTALNKGPVSLPVLDDGICIRLQISCSWNITTLCEHTLWYTVCSWNCAQIMFCHNEINHWVVQQRTSHGILGFLFHGWKAINRKLIWVTYTNWPHSPQWHNHYMGWGFYTTSSSIMVGLRRWLPRPLTKIKMTGAVESKGR